MITTLKIEVKEELERLATDADELLSLANEKSRNQFRLKYQHWYSSALKLVSLLAPDRSDEFQGYYQIDARRKDIAASTYVIQDYVKGLGPTNRISPNWWDIHSVAAIHVQNQKFILLSLKSRIDSVVANIEATILARLQGAELSTAESLKKVSLRAAGALAGVVLEGHLQSVAAAHKVIISKKNPTIGDLNDPLRDAEIYDLPSWRKIQHLGDIRNLCTHKKDREPTAGEVDELIIGVNWSIGNIA